MNDVLDAANKRIEVLEQALKDIIAHQKSVSGSFYNVIQKIAEKALKEEKK